MVVNIIIASSIILIKNESSFLILYLYTNHKININAIVKGKKYIVLEIRVDILK